MTSKSSVSAVTQGIRVSVETFYQAQHSNPQMGEHFFAYRITIRNEGDYTVQLLRRHWIITDSDGSRREVEGEGVVGQQPILEPGESYQYVSGCAFHSEMGRMQGTYLMHRLSDDELFEILIPAFLMTVPYRLN